MVTNNLVKTDLYRIYNVVQNSMILFPKESIISTLRDFFAQDSYYHFSKDLWGFANTPDHTDMDLEAGLADEITTRLFIGENYRKDIVFYPSIIVRNSGSSSVPISMNRETSGVKWGFSKVEDGYGNLKFYRVPESFIFAGAWEGSINIEVLTRSLRSRDDLVELASILFTDIAFNALAKSGVVIKKVSAGAPSESDDRNDKIFRQTITLDVRTEWRREIPVSNVIEVIMTTIEFGRVDIPDAIIAPNLTITTSQTLTDFILNLI